MKMAEARLLREDGRSLGLGRCGECGVVGLLRMVGRSVGLWRMANSWLWVCGDGAMGLGLWRWGCGFGIMEGNKLQTNTNPQTISLVSNVSKIAPIPKQFR